MDVFVENGLQVQQVPWTETDPTDLVLRIFGLRRESLLQASMDGQKTLLSMIRLGGNVLAACASHDFIANFTGITSARVVCPSNIFDTGSLHGYH